MNNITKNSSYKKRKMMRMGEHQTIIGVCIATMFLIVVMAIIGG